MSYFIFHRDNEAIEYIQPLNNVSFLGLHMLDGSRTVEKLVHNHFPGFAIIGR